MNEYKFTMYSNDNIPMHFVIKTMKENDDEDLNKLSNITFECLYLNQIYELSVPEKLVIINHIILAFQSQGHHELSFNVTNTFVDVSIKSKLLEDSLSYLLKYSNSIIITLRDELLTRIAKLENYIDTLQTKKYYITDDVLDKKITHGETLLFNESNHKLFFEDLKIMCEKGLHCELSEYLNIININKLDNEIMKNVLDMCQQFNLKLGIENMYYNYELLYTDKNPQLDSYDFYIKGLFEFVINTYNPSDSDPRKYIIHTGFHSIPNMFTIFKKRPKPIYGIISVSKEFLKYELYHNFLIDNDINIILPNIKGLWISTKYNKIYTGNKNIVNNGIIYHSIGIYECEYKNIYDK